MQVLQVKKYHVCQVDPRAGGAGLSPMFRTIWRGCGVGRAVNSYKN